MSPFRLKWQKVVVYVLPPVVLLIIILSALWHPPSCNRTYREDHSFRGVLQYCNSLSQPMTGQEGTVPPSDGFKLESVYAVIRHGDRSNLHSLPKYKQVKLNCDMNDSVLDSSMQRYVAVMKEQEDFHQSNPKTSAFHDFQLYPQSSVCGAGDLTPIGASQHVRNGEFLHKRYINALGLFKEQNDLKIEDRIMVRSTTKLRTFQSAVAFLFGFLPKFDMSKLSFESAEDCKLCSENGVIPCDCPSIGVHLDEMSSTHRQFTPEVMTQKQTRSTYEEISRRLGVMVSQLPRPSHLYDVSMVHVCHGEFLPGSNSDMCIPAWSVENIHNIVNSNGKHQVSAMAYQKAARLKMYPLLSEIVQHMEKVTQGKTNTVFHLYSGHDSTIEPLAAVLNFSDGHWPRYASRIVFELYSTVQHKEEKLVLFRVLYDGEAITKSLPCCAKNMYKVANLGLCEVSHLQHYVRNSLLKDLGHNGDYKTLCNT